MITSSFLRSLRTPLTRTTRSNVWSQTNRIAISPLARPQLFITLQPCRHYASKKKTKSRDEAIDEPPVSKKKTKSTADFVPGSRQPITDEAALEEYKKAEASMKTASDWFRKECAASESRAAGRVTPALLSPVKVKLPDNPLPVRLEEIATVGVREGSTLVITLFDEQNIKHVESALYESGIPGVVPHRQDNRTVKVPIPKPTVEARLSLFAAAKRKAEDIRQQIRKQHTTSLKRGKFEKHSIEIEEFQKLTDRYIKEVDTILASLQKATGAK